MPGGGGTEATSEATFSSCYAANFHLEGCGLPADREQKEQRKTRKQSLPP